MIRVMCILTFAWGLIIGLAAASSKIVLALPAGDYWADLAIGALSVNFVCWWLGIGLAPVVIIGWPVALLVRYTRRPKKPVGMLPKLITASGIYLWDQSTGTYHKVNPPC